MTTEEKAKAYDEAVEKAESLYKVSEPMSGCNIIIETLFPELKESEDERMRKRIINALHGDVLEMNEIKEAEIWLEKQGEKESDPRYENLEEILAADNIYQMSMNDEMVQEAKEKAVNALSGMCIGRLLGLDEKEHEKLCNDRYGHQDIVSDLKRDCRKKWDWLESLKDKVAPQKQWKPSDEQIEIFNMVLTDEAMDDNVASILRGLSEQLKKLREE